MVIEGGEIFLYYKKEYVKDVEIFSITENISIVRFLY